MCSCFRSTACQGKTNILSTCWFSYLVSFKQFTVVASIVPTNNHRFVQVTVLLCPNGIPRIGVRHQCVCHDASATLCCHVLRFCKHRHQVLSASAPGFRALTILPPRLQYTFYADTTCSISSLSSTANYCSRRRAKARGYLSILYSRIIFTAVAILCATEIGLF